MKNPFKSNLFPFFLAPFLFAPLANPIAFEEKTSEEFEKNMEELLPLTEEEIQQLAKRLQKTQETASNANPNPTPLISVKLLDNAVNAIPPTLKLAKGFATALSFSDINGNIWPIEGFIIGNGDGFEVLKPLDNGQLITISPRSAFEKGNLIVLLQNNKKPISIQLDSGTEEVIYQINFQIPAFGPNSEPPTISNLGLKNIDLDLMEFLEYSPPPNSKLLNVSGDPSNQTSAWAFNNSVFLRTPYTLLSPAYNQFISSQNGTSVFKIENTAMIILTTDEGKFLELSLTEETPYE